MKIFPECQIKPLSECAAGSVVRTLRYRNSGRFALVANIQGKTSGLILFNEHVELEIYNSPNEINVLAYGGQPRFDVDQNGAFWTRSDDGANLNGAMTRTADAWFINVRKNLAYGYSQAQYNLVTGDLVEIDLFRCELAAFGKWRLSLGSDDARIEELVAVAEIDLKTASGAQT